MAPVYLTAATLRDFGVETLAAHLLCRLREDPEYASHPATLGRALARAQNEPALHAEVTLAAEVAALSEPLPAALAGETQLYCAGGSTADLLLKLWAEEVLRRTGDAPYTLGSPTRQLPYPAFMALIVYALVVGARRRHAGSPPVPDLIASPVPPAGAPVFDSGRADVYIVGDPEDAALPDMLDRAASALAGNPGIARWIWMHAPRLETPEAVARCLQRESLLSGKSQADIRMIAGILRVQGTPHVPPLTRYPEQSRTQNTLRQLWTLDACGVPRSRRPALVVDRKVFLGSDPDWEQGFPEHVAAQQGPS